MNIPDVDIVAFLRTATILTFLGVIFAIWRGIRSIQTSQDLPYFRLRRERLLNGWRLFGFAVLLLIFGLFLGIYGEPVALRFIDVTATASLSPTTTLVPTRTFSPTPTLSPTITPTLEFTYTPTITQTPHVPLAVEVQFTSQVTPNPEAVFSELTFSQGLDSLFRPLRPGEEFENPVGHLYAIFSYDNMLDGVQWTALWYREGELVFFETKPWDGGTGGLGFSDWDPVPEEWLPGNYQVQIFVGLEAKAVGNFVVSGAPATRTPTPSVTPTATLSPTMTLSPTPHPTQTRTQVTPSITPQPTQTRTITPSPWPTATQ